MAEESTDLPVTPYMMKLYGDNSGRNSTGKIVPPKKSSEKIPPHILRASIGSCHDFCKFGREHAFAVKTRLPKPRRVTTKAIDKQSSVVVEVSPMKKKASTVKIKQSPGFNTHSTNMPNNNEQSSVDKHSSFVVEVSPMKKKATVKIKQSPEFNTHSANMPNNNEQSSVDKQSSIVVEVSPMKEKTSTVKIKQSPGFNNHSANMANINEQSSVVSEVSPMKNKASTVKVKQSPGFNTHSANMSNNNEQSSVDKPSSAVVEVSPMKKKASTVKIKQSPGFNSHSANMPTNNEQSSVSLVRKKVSMVEIKRSSGSNTFSHNIPINNEQQVMKKSLDSSNSVSSNVLAERKRISGNKLKTSPSPKSHSRSNESMKQEVSVFKAKLKISSNKVSSKAKEKFPSAKSSISLKPKSLAKKPLYSSESSGNLNRNNTKIIGNTTATSKAAIKKVSVLPKILSSPRPSLKNIANLNERKHLSLKKVGSPLTNHNEIKNAETEQSKGNEVEQPSKSDEVEQPSKSDEVEQPSKSDEVEQQPKSNEVEQQPKSNEVEQPRSDKVQEKTLYVIKMETENRSFESDTNKIYADESLSPPSSSPLPELSSVPSLPYCSSTTEEDEGESEYTVSELENTSFSLNNELDGAENTESQVVDEKRKSGVVYSEDLKLKLRRGKMVNMESENNIPRRLKFRRGRVLDENQNVEEYVRRKSFKRRGGVDENSYETAQEKVILRHQDVQGKMDAQGLFNNVIEETASKLVGNRKSKVKALVGAFETVISLQDKKPTTNNVT